MSSFGHVALVQSLNGDGTFNVSEMNFTGFNQIDTRRSTMHDVQGFILPPGSKPTTDAQFMSDTGAFTLPGGGSFPGAQQLGSILSWVSDSRNWWRLGFVAVGSVMIAVGVNLYFFHEESAAIERVAPLAEMVA